MSLLESGAAVPACVANAATTTTSEARSASLTAAAYAAGRARPGRLPCPATGVSSRNASAPGTSAASAPRPPRTPPHLLRRARASAAATSAGKPSPSVAASAVASASRPTTRSARRPGIPADRRLRPSRARVERPPRNVTRVVAGDQQCLHRADLPAPRPGAGLPALAIARGRPAQPLRRPRRVAGHEKGEPRRPGRVRELHELPLVELARLSCRVARRRALVPFAPVHTGRLGSNRHGERRLAHHGSNSRQPSTRPASSKRLTGGLGDEAQRPGEGPEGAPARGLAGRQHDLRLRGDRRRRPRRRARSSRRS